MQARHAGREGGPDAPTPVKVAAAGARTPFGLQQPAAGRASGGADSSRDSKGPARGSGASKAAPLPKAPKGCWLDAARGQAAAKRKAQILAVGANKRAALGQGLKAAAGGAATSAEGGTDAAPAAAAGDEAGGSGDGHNGYTVLYKFNEGYTNAVKRPIKMAELLGLQQQQ